MKNCAFTSVKPPRLQAERAHYNEQVGAALDGMWTAFVEMGAHWTISHTHDGKQKNIGYCVVNDQNKILQFMLTHPSHSVQVFAYMIDELNITGAYVATCEAQYLAHCLDHQKSVRVNAIMFQEGAHKLATTLPKNAEFRVAKAVELDLAVEFGVAALGCDQQWLRGYYGERIDRCELFGYWQDGTLIAAGECRPSNNAVFLRRRGHGCEQGSPRTRARDRYFTPFAG